MIYPFRFNIGDRVRVSSTSGDCYKNVVGTVKALELSANKTTAVVQADGPNDRPFRVHESVLRGIS